MVEKVCRDLHDCFSAIMIVLFRRARSGCSRSRGCGATSKPGERPAAQVAQVQAAIDAAQHHLDTQHGRDARTAALFAMATAGRPSSGV